MFPGCTELDVCARYQDVLRNAGFGPLLGQRGSQTARGDMLLERLLLMLAAIFGF